MRFTYVMTNQTYNRPTEVTSHDGRVQLDGPDGVDVALTPGAARETGRRLKREAATAREQQRKADETPE